MTSLNCDPSDITAELRLGQSGRVRWPNPDKAASAGGVLADGFDMRGAICRVRGTGTPVGLAQLDEGAGQFPPPVETVISYFVAVLPSVWEKLRYERAKTILGRLQAAAPQCASEREREREMAILAQVLHVVSCGAVDLEPILAWEPESFTISGAQSHASEGNFW